MTSPINSQYDDDPSCRSHMNRSFPQINEPNQFKATKIDARLTNDAPDDASFLPRRRRRQDVQEEPMVEARLKIGTRSISVPPLITAANQMQEQTNVGSCGNEVESFESTDRNLNRDVSDEVRRALSASRKRIANEVDVRTYSPNSSLRIPRVNVTSSCSTLQSIRNGVPTVPPIKSPNLDSLVGLVVDPRQPTKSPEDYLATVAFCSASKEAPSFDAFAVVPTTSEESPESFLEQLRQTSAVEEPVAVSSKELEFLQNKSVLEKATDKAPMWLASLFAHALLVVGLAFIVIKVDKKQLFEIISEPGFTEQTVLDEVFDPEATFDNSQEIEIETLNFDVQSEIVADVPDVSAFHDENASTLALAESALGFEPIPSADITNWLGSVNGDELAGRGEAKAVAIATGGGNEGSEKAVALALAWLAEHQLPNGAWTFQLDKIPTCGGRCANAGVNDSINAATALGLLPFLAAGHTPTTGKYKRVVAKGLNYLTQAGTISENGRGYNDSGNMYAHGLATIALCETYAMLKPREKSRYRELGYIAQDALNFIEYAQADDGGWRYSPKQAGDTSVVGWQTMALKSGQLGGFNVSNDVVRNAIDFLQDVVGFENGSRYYYTANSSSSNATDSIGLLCRLYFDWRVDNPQIQAGAARLSEIGPQLGNPYYNYYATQLFHHLGGEMWSKWNREMRDALINSQRMEGHERGSWFPKNADGHCYTGGRLYATSLNCMILEVYYRHMPLYQRQANDTKFPLEVPIQQ